MSILPDILHLNCLLFGNSPDRIFSTAIKSTATVGYLREAFMVRKLHSLQPNGLQLWKVSLPFNDTIEHDIKSLPLDSEPPLNPEDTLDTIFSDLPDKGCLHIVFKQRTADIPFVSQRRQYLMQVLESPSSGGKPARFFKKQNREEPQYLCSHPREAEDPVPVTLLEPIFAQFVDDCEDHKPTAKDNRFICELAHEMCKFERDESHRVRAFKNMLESYGAPLHSDDGQFVWVITVGKDEIADCNADPFLEAMCRYREILKKMNKSGNKITQLRSVLPCLHVIIFGPCIGIAGSIFTGKVQSDVLTPIIPLFWHSTDISMQTMAARTFGALKIALKRLKPCPYPQTYTDSTGKKNFSYDMTQSLRHKLIFYGKTVDPPTRRKICIKFVKQYLAGAHRFCARKGHAPELLSYKCLPGGWKMVVMDVLDINHGDEHVLRRTGSYRKFGEMDFSDFRPLKKVVTDFIHELHAEGYVHGDLRNVNLFARDGGEGVTTDGFMLLDFDWAGKTGETYYPMYVNRQDISRPDEARDGNEITVEHDLEMLGYVFHPGWAFGETASSTSIESTKEVDMDMG